MGGRCARLLSYLLQSSDLRARGRSSHRSKVAKCQNSGKIARASSSNVNARDATESTTRPRVPSMTRRGRLSAVCNNINGGLYTTILVHLFTGFHPIIERGLHLLAPPSSQIHVTIRLSVTILCCEIFSPCSARQNHNSKIILWQNLPKNYNDYIHKYIILQRMWGAWLRRCISASPNGELFLQPMFYMIYLIHFKHQYFNTDRTMSLC